jgi:hypothetical protein
MRISVATNAKQIEKMTKKRGKELRDSIKKALSITAQHGINIILDRTKEGVGYKGGAFKSYTPEYAAFRTSRNRSVEPPNLTFSGRMLGSMTTTANRKRAEIFFTTGDESRKAAFNNKTRPFFGFSDAETVELRNMFARKLK